IIHGRISALPYIFLNPPVNSLSLHFLTEFAISLEKLKLYRSCRGVIITSTPPKVFSAGLDIYPEHCAEFWKAVQDAWLKLYGSTKVTIATINGSRPAGGCLLALCCDYRIMTDNRHYNIGLNEKQLAGFQLVPEDKVLNTASETMMKWLAVPDHALQINKSMMRKCTIDKLLANREADTTNFVSFFSHIMGHYITYSHAQK
uniref:Enoyl-CoA delta isomerase 1 n=1 Tax=Cyprinus carpio carpio TaxID=630221 RepID=A0A9J8DCC7_CYPCA